MEFKQAIDNIIINEMTKMKIPGVGIAIHKDGEMIYSRGYGLRNIEDNLPFTPDTLNGFGSNTKAFTCVAIMQLNELDKLDIHDPVSKYLDFQLSDDITIHHLMSHSSGIPNLNLEQVENTKLEPNNKFPLIAMGSWDDFFYHINGAGDAISFKPGERFFYFDSGYTMLGRIIEKISGMSYAEYVRKNILVPLDMNRSSFLKTHLQKDNNISIPYEPNEDNLPSKKKFPFSEFIHPAGGLVSSSVEMMNFLIMLMNNGKFNEKQILTEQSIKLMTTIYFKTNLFGWNYCYGLASISFFDDTMMLHNGGITGGYSHIAYLKEKKLGITLVTNYPAISYEPFYKLFTSLLDKELSDQYPLLKRWEFINTLVGDYQTYKGILKSKVVNKLGQLFFETEEPKASFALIPKSSNFDCLEFKFNYGSLFETDLIFHKDGETRLLVFLYSYLKIN